jgi:hypothetical protein
MYQTEHQQQFDMQLTRRCFPHYSLLHAPSAQGPGLSQCTTQCCAAFAVLLSTGFLSSLSACLPAMVRLAQQQLSSAASANSWTPLSHLLSSARKLLCCWHELVGQMPAFMQVVVRTLLPLVQQLQGCGSLLMRPAAAAPCSAPTATVEAGSSSSCEHWLQCALFGVQQAASMLLLAIDQQDQLNGGGAADVLRLQNDAAVAEMQLQLLTTWAAQLHQQHTAQQQQLPPGTAAASSSSTQQQQQPAKQQHRADLLSIPAFHIDMMQLLPGGQAYLDAAAEEAADWELTVEANPAGVLTAVRGCCQTISHYLHSHLQSIAGQQQLSRNALVVSGAAVQLAVELQLLAAGAVQRQREQSRQQQQQRQQALTPGHQAMTDSFALQTLQLLGLHIKALVATSRSCLPPELLQQAGLQLLQALAAPLQQWQLSRTEDSFVHTAAEEGALPLLGEALHLLVTAACGAEPTCRQASVGEHDRCFSVVACQDFRRLCLQSYSAFSVLAVRTALCMHDL